MGSGPQTAEMTSRDRCLDDVSECHPAAHVTQDSQPALAGVDCPSACTGDSGARCWGCSEVAGQPGAAALPESGTAGPGASPLSGLERDDVF